MKELSLSRLHCEDCSQELVAQLTRMTGRAGFAYDEEEQVLTVPEGVDLDLVYDVLSADKIAIRHERGPVCSCIECRVAHAGHDHERGQDADHVYDHEHDHDHDHDHEGHHDHDIHHEHTDHDEPQESINSDHSSANRGHAHTIVSTAHRHEHASTTQAHSHAAAASATHTHINDDICAHDHTAHDHAAHDHTVHDHAHDHIVPLHARGRSGHAAHHHGHSHGHTHSHAHGSSVRNIAIVFAMNLLFSVSEFIFGAILNSTAIFADAVHDLGDAISVGLALVLEKRSKKHADGTYSFGHRRFSLLGALITGLVLLTGSAFSLTRAVPRLLAPTPVNYDGMLIMALVAIALNAVSAWALSRGSSRNESMLNLHMLEDMVGWIGILVMAIVLRYTDWYILDPLFSIGLSLFIMYKAAPGVWSTLKILMESVPENVPLHEIEAQLLALPHVHGFTHLHLWSMDGQSNNFAVSLFTDVRDPLDQKLLRERVRTLLLPYSVECSTVEIDYDPDKRFVGKVG